MVDKNTQTNSVTDSVENTISEAKITGNQFTEDQRAEKLEKELETLRKDFKDINETLKNMAQDKRSELEARTRLGVRKAQNQAQRLWGDVNETGSEVYDRARHQMEDTIEEVNHRVRQNPLQSVAIVAGVSYIIGFLSRK